MIDRRFLLGLAEFEIRPERSMLVKPRVKAKPRYDNGLVVELPLSLWPQIMPAERAEIESRRDAYFEGLRQVYSIQEFGHPVDWSDPRSAS